MLNAVENKKAQLGPRLKNMPTQSFAEYKASAEEAIRLLDERIAALEDKRSAEARRLKNQRASFAQRLRIRTEEQDRKLKIAYRDNRSRWC